MNSLIGIVELEAADNVDEEDEVGTLVGAEVDVDKLLESNDEDNLRC